MYETMAFRTLSDPKRHKIVLDGFESTVFQNYIKYSFIYLLVPILSLGIFRLCIICIGPIAGQKSTEGYVILPALLSITSHYFNSCMAAAFGIL